MTRTHDGFRYPRSRRWEVPLALALAFSAATSRSAAPQVKQPPPVTIAPKTDTVVVSRLVVDTMPRRWRGNPEGFRLACTRMAWTTCDPLWSDEQELKGDADNYGPHAFIAPAPDLGAQTNDAAFATARLVGVVWVKPGTRPNTYQNLNLTAPYTCIFLQSYRSPSPGRFKASLVPNNSPDCHAVTPSGTPFEVRAAAVPSNFDSGNDSQNADEIPPIARFHEGKSKSDKEIPLLGLRCGSKWCIILPHVLDGDSVRLPHKFDHANQKTWEVHGWHDVQHLSKKNVASGLFERTKHEASIVPDSGLKYKNFANGAQHAATIRFWGKPTGDYVSKWGFGDKENQLYLWKVTISGRDYWHGVVVNADGIPTVVYVEQWHKGSHPPPAARFRWDDEDEGIWVECDDGCCYVSPPPS
jgi:hypothetical protein